MRSVIAWKQDGLMRRIAKNSGWVLGGSGAAGVIGLVTLTVRTRDLGAELLGLYAVILAYIGLMDRLTSLRSWVPLIKFGAEAKLKSDHKGLVASFKMALLSDILGSLLGFILALAGAATFAAWKGWGRETVLMIAVSAAPLLVGWIGAPTGLLRIFDRFRMFTYRKMMESLLGLGGVLLAWWMGWGLWGYLITTAVTACLGKIWLFMAAITVLRQENLLRYWKDASVREWKKFAGFQGWSYLSSLVDIPFKQLDLIILSTVLSLEAVGIYRIMKQVSSILSVLTDAIYQAVYPQFAALVSSGNFRNAAKYGMKIGAVIALLLSPVSIALALTSYWWMGAVFGPDFQAGWGAMSLLLVLKVFAVPTMTLHPLFLAAGYVKQNTWILALANSLYIVFLWAGASTFGLYGVVAAWFLQVFVVVYLKVQYLYRNRSMKIRNTEAG